MKRFTPVLYSISFGTMMWLGWTPKPFFFLLFIGFTAIIFLEEYFSNPHRRTGRFLLFSYLAFLIWNIATTWWTGNATFLGGVFAVLFNSSLMLFPVWFFHAAKFRFGKTVGYLSLIAAWLSFEFLHMRWELTWSWLTLGNGMANYPALLQWYEFTGHLGGSVWILLLNILFYEAIIQIRTKTKKLNQVITPFLITLIVPVLISIFIFSTYKEKGNPVEVVVVQPNIDPWKEKFQTPTKTQLDKFLRLSEEQIDSNTDYLVWPETAFNGDVWVDEFEISPHIRRLQEFVSRFPKLKLVTGVDAYKEYPDEEHATITVRYDKRQNIWYDVFNTALQIDNEQAIQYYHKSKLVPGAERMPYPGLFKILEPLALNLGGMSGSLGAQEEREVFFNRDSSIGIAPVICYESVYGEYVSRYIRNGASLIFIITNDGWWKNTAGHKQHLHYASLRAIEMRRDIARSANTGISCFIDQRGIIHQPQKWWTEASIKSVLYANERKTFYTRFGDYIGRIACAIAAILFVLILYRKIFRSKHDLLR